MSASPATYKAFIYEQYGKAADQLKIREVPAGALAADGVRIKVHSASINPVDCMILEVAGEFFTGGKPSVEKPYRFGHDVSGVVAKVGADVKAFQVGQEVFARAEPPSSGTVAEYIDIPEKLVALKPKSIDHEHAASVPLVALTSYQGLFEHGDLKAGQRLLVLGGSSSTGIFAIQFAKAIGAHVVATTSAKNSEFVKSLGADVTVDYHTQKWVEVIEKNSIDLIYDCGMEPASWNGDAQVVLKHGGRYVSLLPIPQPIESPIGATPISMGGKGGGEGLAKIAALIDEGKVKPVVDTIVPFEKLVEGVERVQSRRAVGKVVVKVI